MSTTMFHPVVAELVVGGITCLKHVPSVQARFGQLRWYKERRTGRGGLGSLALQKRRVKSVPGQEDMDLVNGINAVASVLQSDTREKSKLYIAENVIQTEAKNKTNRFKLSKISQLATAQRIPIVYTNKLKLENMFGKGHQGVGLIASKLYPSPPPPLEELESKSGVTLLLDKVHDPMNLGSVLRSSLFFGVDRVVMSGCCPISPTVVKASAGASEWLQLHTVLNLADFIDEAIDCGWEIVATVAPDNTQKITNLTDVPQDRPIGLVMGNEGSGIRPHILRKCTLQTTISPHRGLNSKELQGIFLLESLNVGVATGILLERLTYKQR